MKKQLIIGLLLLLSSAVMYAQDLEGKWTGQLNVQSSSLRVNFNIKLDNGKYTSTMDSPDQGAYGIKVESTSIFGTVVTLKATSIGVEYFGVYNDKTKLIEGKFTQSGMSFDMSLSRVEEEKADTKGINLQNVDYKIEEVTYKNAVDNITLAGTLTIPKKEGKHPVVILISGSGPQNRDEEIFGHKTFLVLADYLTQKGIAVLRFDDRGVGASEGDFSKATTPDFVNDVEAGVNYLKTRKDIDFSRLGLIGHSEGGLVAPMLAAKSDDIKFMVLLAAPGVRGEELLYTQNEMILKQRGAPANVIDEQNALVRKMYKCILDEKDIKVAKKRVQEIIRQNILASPQASQLDDNRINGIVQQQSALVTPWFRCFLEYDPVSSLKKVKCPVLALNGEKDIQVESKENLAAIEKALSKAKVKYKTVELEGLNHLFLKCETGDVLEYPTLKTSFSVKAMGIIHNWIIEL